MLFDSPQCYLEVSSHLLLCGNHCAAENAAIVYSMLGCCKAHGVNFRQRLVYFLDNVHNYDTDYSKDLAELLPHNFAKEVQKGSEPSVS